MDETWIREFSYTCTEEEIYLCLKRSGQRKAGPVRVGVQTGILLLLTIYCLIGFFADGMTDWRAFGVAVIAVILAGILLLVPEKRFRHDAAREAELNRQRVSVRRGVGLRHAGRTPALFRLPAQAVYRHGGASV